MHTGNARILNQNFLSPEKRIVSIPFLIYAPDTSPSPTSPEELQTTKNSGITTVEIIRSVEIKLNGSDESGLRRHSSGTGDLLFSDTDSKSRGKEASWRRGARNNESDRPRLSDILSLTSSETKNEYQNNAKSSSKRVLSKTLAADGLNFNSRILLGNILIRNNNNEMQEDKYSYFSDPKVSDNMYHATYVNRNSSTAFNKSRINVKFPPKMFPLKNVNVQENRPNKTSIISNKISQTRKALYLSRIGKQTKINHNNTQTRNPESYNKHKLSEVTPATTSQAQNKIENLQALTHWDFGKKTPHTQRNDGNYIPISGLPTTPSTTQNENILASDLPHIMQPAKSTPHPPEGTKPNSATENEIKEPVGPEAIFWNAFPQHESVPIRNNINSIPTVPFLSNLNNVKSPQHYHAMHADNRDEIRKNLGPHLFPNTHVQDNSNHIRSGSVEDANTRTYNTQTTVQNYIPVVNIGQQSERQHGERDSWQSVYFVPHVALRQQHQPTVISLQNVENGVAAPTVPIILQKQNSQLYQPALVGPNHAVPTPNGIIYEGKSLV
jgi:hypothetical protein